MTTRERFLKVIHFEKPDRVPMFEFCPYWDLTMKRWREEGLPDSVQTQKEMAEYFGLDYCAGFLPSYFADGFPQPEESHAVIEMDEAAYDEVRPNLFPENAAARDRHIWEELAEEQKAGNPVMLNMYGFFWFPRVLLGIEPHLYSFYDEPELYHKICTDQVEWMLKYLDAMFEVVIPDMFNMSEDMSYNLGPMISEEHFDEFLLPYYLKISEKLKAHNVLFAVDSDGMLEPMIPWLKRGGVGGIYPLEFNAGIDINRIRKNYPDMVMFSAFNKLTMSCEPEVVEAECQRILPALQSGGYIPSCDHQTPPAVSMDQYRTYVKLLRKYCNMAGEA